MVKLVRSADARPGLYLVSFAFVVDFHRGDSGGTFYALAVALGAYALMTFVSRLRWARRPVRRAWPGTPGSAAGPAALPQP